MCTKKISKHTPRETELPEGLQMTQAGESPLEYQDPERGNPSLAPAAVSGPDDAHVLKFPGDKIWPFTLQASAAVILVIFTAGTISLTGGPMPPVRYVPVQIFSTVVILAMIYPSVAQLQPKARKDYNYWGIFSTLLILLVWNLKLMVDCIKFEVKVAEYNRSVSRDWSREMPSNDEYSSILDYINKMNGFGAATLSLVILHFTLTVAYFISLTIAMHRHRKNGGHCKPPRCSRTRDGVLPGVAVDIHVTGQSNAENRRGGRHFKLGIGTPRNEKPAARAHGRRHGTDGTADNDVTRLEPISLPIPDRAHYSPSCREHPLRLNPVNPSNTVHKV